MYRPKVVNSNFGGSNAVSPTSNLPIVIGPGSNSPNIASTNIGGSKASTTSISPKATTLATIEGKKVSKGKKVATPEIVDINYSVVEDMNKIRESIYIFELSKINSQQELILKAWKDDTKYFVEEKGNDIVNLV